jgi:hypothetical protein
MRSFLAQTINAIAKISLSSVLPLLALTGAFPQRIPAQDNIIATLRRAQWRLSGLSPTNRRHY